MRVAVLAAVLLLVAGSTVSRPATRAATPAGRERAVPVRLRMVLLALVWKVQNR